MTLQMHYDEIAEEARAEGRAEVIRQMIANGMSIDMIAKCCGISEDEIIKVTEIMK